MTTTTISALPTLGTVVDNTYFAAETPTPPSGNVTQKVSASVLRSYMTTLPYLTVTGVMNGTLTTAAQPNITSLGTLSGLTASGPIASTVATGTAPLSITSQTLVPNLYVERASVADVATNGLTTATQFVAGTGSDVLFSGTNSTLVATLKTVNNAGVYGGKSGSMYYIPQLNINSKGIVTSSANVAVNLDLSTQAVTHIAGASGQIVVSAGVGNVTVGFPSTVVMNDINASSAEIGSVLANQINATQVYDNSNRVVSSMVLTEGPGITITGQNSSGPVASATIINSGVVDASAGSGISVTKSPGGTLTIQNTGVTGIAGSGGIVTDNTTGGVIVSPASGYNGYGRRYVSTGTPSGGNDGDIWYRI